MFDFAQARRDLAYLLPGIVVALAGFVTLTCGLALSLGTLVAWIGVPALLATLGMARMFATLERRRVAAVTGHELPSAQYAAGAGFGSRRMRATLKCGQYWRDLAHGVLVAPLSVFTWSVAVIWTTAAVAGTLYPIYGWTVPRYPDSQGLADLMGWHTLLANSIVNLAVGLVFLGTGPAVLRGLTAVHTGFARMLLTDEKAALRAQAEHLTASRSAAVQAEAWTLRRVERDIHDGPQQRLVRLTMDLEAARRRMNDNPDAAKTLVEEALAQSHEALTELRAVSRGIAPPILIDRGLAAALAAAVARCPVDTALECDLLDGRRLPESVENAAYFVVSEALTNVAKHARADSCAVRVTTEATALWLRVTDDGVGDAHLGKGHGLAGLVDRLAGVDGRLDMHSPVGGPTVLTAEIPLPR
ncbi:sensor domain-containing protein [Nocardia sp. NEAU-G5]|uniref:histidine kinase n=1 Tax=Nocardia albiluteola TaxID=2842303 RepID=A0ABS6B6K5_9NOCA|nr:sensor histidine kinase [Nocardia albiluteola]MBU3065889.1 sensor domain-containing protein [Nocardia albiluteola]